MIICGFDKLTLLNYPDNVACILFTKGCNYNCPFCHNSSLIKTDIKNTISEEDIFEYLEKRKNILDGVCISGGEPLIQNNIKRFIKRIKEFGLKVKLDTNGSNPMLLKELIDEKLIDYVAMDIKNTLVKYPITSGINNPNLNHIINSINIIENSDILYEFRTTIVKEYHNVDDIKEILKLIKPKSKYYLQNFVNSDGVNNKKLNSFTDDELNIMKENLKKYPNVFFRDI